MIRPRELPRELSERKRLHTWAAALMDLLFDRPTNSDSPWVPPSFPDGSPRYCFAQEEWSVYLPWEPPSTSEASLLCPVVTQTTGSPITPMRPEIRNAFPEANLRLVKIAEAIEPLEESLGIAGLAETDLGLWRAHRLQGDAVRKQPDGASVASAQLFFLYDGDVVGERLDELREALARLRHAVIRIEHTVSPKAVLDRLLISDDRREATLDGKRYKGLLPKSEGLYLEHLRQGAGEWVSFSRVAQKLELAELKINRINKTLGRKHPKLKAIIESKGGAGNRIVLPLASN